MPKIDESKIADILNSLLTASINRGENLIQDLDKSVNTFNKNVDSLTNTLSARTSEVKELAKALSPAPKIAKTIKTSTIIASFVAGVAFAAAVYAWPLVSVSNKFIQTREAYSELVIKYDEISKQASKLNTELRAHIKVYDRLDSNSKQALVNILIEERQKIIQQQEEEISK